MIRIAMLALALAAPAQAASLDSVAVDWSRRRGGGSHRHYRDREPRRPAYVPRRAAPVQRAVRMRSMLVPLLLGSDGAPKLCWLHNRVLLCP